ncbi:MAG TPA: HNH endonuclease signature motif containing protein [Thermomicrobiales bacterium]|nr:HNH endonuclease signature motif containing protein [Thermomicrobiales bacterium]
MGRMNEDTSARNFWAKVTKTETCWLWTGTTTDHATHSYGLLRRNRQQHRAHRFAWELTHGPIPEGKIVCHNCDVTLCVKPDHLFLGTPRDNTQDMLTKGRHGTARVRGEAHHKAVLDEASVRRIRGERASGRSLGSLATEYGVSKGLVWQIDTRRIWKHLD